MSWCFADWQAIAIVSVPVTGRKCPSKANSPINSNSSVTFSGNCPVAIKIPKAMGKSSREPSLGKSAGARLMVKRLVGN